MPTSLLEAVLAEEMPRRAAEQAGAIAAAVEADEGLLAPLRSLAGNSR
ncbi:MAG: hypothetical protein WA724_09725 [Candidatus Dormiibacterota bacterium]